MKKLFFILILSIVPFISNAQTDLATWNLTSNGNVSSTVPTITADTFTFTGVNTTFSGSGASTTNWSTSYQESKFLQIAVQPTVNNSAVITNLNFRNSRTAFQSANYRIKYYISTNNSTINNTQFFDTANNGDITLVENGSVPYQGTNVTAAFSTPIYLNSNQKLIIRLYGNASTNTTNWLIEDNSLKIVGCIPSGTPGSYGTDSWYGSVYRFENNNPTDYLGFVTESETFNRNNSTNGPSGATTNLCEAPIDYFFVRYKMRKNFAAGQYSITVGADDGYRFSIDGGATWVAELSDYIPQSYASKTHTLCLSGSTDLVIEYYENGGDSRVSFTYNQITVAAPTSLTASASICDGSSRTLTAVGSGPFEWGTGSVGQNIIGQTGNSITVSPSSTTTYWVRRVLTTPCIIYSTALTSTVTVVFPATAPTSISSTPSNCPGAAVTLTAVGGTGNTYQWGTGTVGSNIIAGATGVSVVVNPTASTTNYWVRRVNTTPCSGNTSAATLVYNLLPVPGDQTSFGNESWTGYVYNWNATNLTPTTYLGYVTEPQIFDRNFGGAGGVVTGTTTQLCATPNDNFFIRYKMRKNFAPGQYSITVGADDGYRFSIDGGATWVAGLSNYTPHSYSTTTLSICLNGSTDLVIEYFENAVDARVSFTYSLNPVTAPTSLTTSGSICNGGSRTLTAGGSGPFEWGTGTVGENILGQTGSSITVSPNVTTTYWVRRRVTTPCLGYSNALTSTVTVVSPATAPTSITGGDFIYCDNSTITLTASGGSGNTYQWGTGTTIGSNPIAGTGASITVTLTNTTTYWVRRTNTAPCTGNTDGVSKTITRTSPPGDPTVFGDNQWHVYGFNSNALGNPTNYRGYYVQNLGTNVGFNSKLKWLETATPSSAPDWQGCTVNATNYTFIHKRRGFPCGRYQLAFLYYDDDTVVTVTDANGTVWTQTYTGYYNGGTGLSQPINGTTTFALDAKSTVEVRTMNGNGDSKAGVVFTNSGTATYANGSWDKTASYSDIQVNDNLNLAADLTVCSCTVQSGRVVTVQEDKSLVVLENISVANGGKIIVENNGSLVQVNDNATYTGANDTFEMKRNTQPVYRLDYTYWTSPIKAVSGFTLKNLSPNTLASKYYKWEDAWVAVNSNTEVMVPGKGYIVRSPQTFAMQGQVGAVPQIFNSSFIGQPNNGVVNIAVSGNKWNLIGNPYPSALNLNEFYNNTTNRNLLEGTVYFWTHNTQIALDGSTGFYNYSPSDYAAFNMSGGTGTAASSEPNALNNVPTGYVAAGQAFFVQGSGSGNIVFNNSMRIKQGGLNNQFFKPTPTQEVQNWYTTGKHRVWLNLTSAQNDFNQALVGYIENATNDLDWGYDGEVFSGGSVMLYSILGDKKLTIQGKALPFSNQDEVPLGYQTSLTGTLKISIDHVDGLFEGQNVYLKDNVTGIVHNLKDSDYTFTTVPGTFNDRFVLRYLPQEDLSTNIPVVDENSIVVFNKNNQISIKSAEQTINSVEVYDLQGRVLLTKNNIKSQDFTTQTLSVSNQVVLVKVITENSAELVKKVMLK